MNLLLWIQQRLCIQKKKLKEEEEEEGGGGKKRNKIACVFGLYVELIINLSVFLFLFGSLVCNPFSHLSWRRTVGS
jgi:hypothetical protein